MGTCRIEIEAVGPHDNGTDTDMDALARAFVTTLKTEGHAVTSARFRVVADDTDMLDIALPVPTPGPTRPAEPPEEIDPMEKYKVEFTDPYYRVSGEVPLGQRDLSEVQNALHERVAGFAGAKGMTAVDLRLLTVEDIVRNALLVHMEFKLQ